MAVKSGGNPKPLVGSVTSQEGAKTVIAERIQNVYLESTPSFTRFDPFATVPPLPANFIDRPELSEPLLNSLLANPSAVGLTAVEGMGGVGKSIAALSICHNKRIRDAFPDGIIWLTFGRQSGVSLAQRIEQVAAALNHRFPVYTEATFRSLLSNKAVLIVLDDVWTLDAAEPFLPPPGRSRLLYTSRNREIAGPLGADGHEIGTLKPGQAREFLLRWSGREHKLPSEPLVEGILGECKGLVLALAMIGSTLRAQDDDEWAAVLTDLRRAQLKQVGMRPGGYAYETLHASIDVSVDALDSSTRQAYLQLAVLLEDMPAPPILLQALWGGDSDHVRRLARKLVARSLAARDAEGSLRLHDLQLDYLRAEHHDPAALALIHATVLRSQHVIALHPEQFSSQMIGRLLTYASPAITSFVKHLDAHEPRPRMRPLWPTLQAAGSTTRILEGHSHWVNAVALSADGRWALSGSYDKTVRVWDLQGNAPTRIPEGHRGWVTAVALSADGRWALSGSNDITVRVWDLQGNAPTRIPEGHRGSVTAVALSADGRWALSGSYDKTVRVWDLQGNAPTRILEGHSDWVRAVALSADGRWALSGSNDETVRVWDLQGNAPTRIPEGHRGSVNAVALSADGRWALSGSDDKTVRVWDMEMLRSSSVFTCDGPGLSCCWSAGYIAIGDGGGQVYLLKWEE